LTYYHCCSIDPRSLGTDIDNSTTWNRIFDLIGDPIGQKEAVLCQQTFKTFDRSNAKIAACASCCKRLLSSDGPTAIIHMKIDDLPSAFFSQTSRFNS